MGASSEPETGAAGRESGMHAGQPLGGRHAAARRSSCCDPARRGYLRLSNLNWDATRTSTRTSAS